MKIIQALAAAIKPNPHGVEARLLHEASNATVVHMTLAPGQSVPRHGAPVDVLFFVLEGAGVIECGDERAEVAPGTLVSSSAGTLHAVHNSGAGPFRLLILKVPTTPERQVPA